MAKRYNIKNVRRRGGKWQIRFYDSKRQPTQTYVPRDFDAFSAKQIEAERNRLYFYWESQQHDFDPWVHDRPGADAARDFLTMHQAVELHIEEKVAAGDRGERGGWTKATARGKRSPLRLLARTVGKQQGVDQMVTEDLKAFIHDGGGQKKDLSHATRRTYRGCARSFITWLVKEGHLAESDVPDLPPPLHKRRRAPVYVTEKELEAICEKHLEHADASAERSDWDKTNTRHWYVNLYWFRFWLGHRPGEAMEQRVGACDLGRWMMQIGGATFDPKNKKDAVIPIVPPARPMVKSLCLGPDGEKRPAGERLFGRKSFKKPSEAFREAALEVVPRKVNQEGLSFYNLRHSCGMHWLRKGVPKEVVQKLLRHSSQEMTNLYADFEPTDTARHFERVQGIFEDTG